MTAKISPGLDEPTGTMSMHSDADDYKVAWLYKSGKSHGHSLSDCLTSSMLTPRPLHNYSSYRY